MRHNKILGLATFPLTLMAFTNDTNIVRSLVCKNNTIAHVDTIVARGYFSEYVPLSTRNDEMATINVCYEVFKMENVMIVTEDQKRDTYSINYWISADLNVNVKYRNGVGGWFTETANTELDYVSFEVGVISTADVDTFRRTREQTESTPLHVVEDYSSQHTSVIVSSTQTHGYGYYINEDMYFTESEMTTYGYSWYSSSYDVDTFCSSFTSDGYKKFRDHAEFPNQTLNGQTLNAYGTFSMSFDEDPDYFRISYSASLYLARGGFWGECHVTNTDYITIYV